MAMALDAPNLDEVGARVRELIAAGAARPDRSSTKSRRAPPRAARQRDTEDRAQRRRSGRRRWRSPISRKLPVLTTWPLDAGPFITLPLVITKDPRSGRNNVGMYRMQVFNGRETAMHWQRHKHGRAHADAWGARVPVAVAIGTDPALTYAATAPLPPMLDEFAFAGLLRGKPVELVAREERRSDGARRRRVRARRLRRQRGSAPRGAVRRSHRRLQFSRSLSDVSRRRA